MQVKFLFFIFTAFLVMESNAYMARDVVAYNADYPNKCFVEKYSMVLEFGKGYPVPRKCELMTCNSTLHDNKYDLSIAGCGSLVVKPPCRLSQVNLRKIYPHCCPTPIC